MQWPLDVFDRRLSRAKLWEQATLKLKDNKLTDAVRAGEEIRKRRRLESIGLPPLFL
jgi:hypothetical protein